MGLFSWSRSRRVMVGGLALALLAPLLPATTGTAPVAQAASRCAGWVSRVSPPPSIRVLRTASGTVEEVHFTTYVATVMASGEWPTWLPRTALEAGATAVKQYAWYYRLRGNHRSHYRTAAGECYDVRDDTNDQLYRPEYARPTQKQLDAIAATWALSLRKNGRFFLTGYRAGADVGCAKDTDGWRLYAASVERCSRQGWSRQRIQERYYAPRIGFVWHTPGAGIAGARGDQRLPIVTAPRITLRSHANLHGPTGVVHWGGADAGSGVASFQLQRRVGDGAWRNVRLEHPRARVARITVDPRRATQVRVRARDGAGNLSPWATSRVVTKVVRQSGAARLKGSWRLVESKEASGGTLHRALGSTQEVSFAFRGRSVAIVAPTGRRKGIVRIRVEGRPVARIDLERLPDSGGRVIWTRSWHANRDRQVGLVVESTPGGSSVDVDAFLVLR